MKLQTKRLTLIPCTQEAVSTFACYEPRDHIKAHLNELERDPSLYGWGAWLVKNKETNQIIGDIGFKGKPGLEKTVEIGYGILPSFQNNGFATEAVSRLIEWAFESDDVLIIVAECLKDNIPSIKVLEKLAMRQSYQDGTMIYWEIKKNS